MSSVKRPILMLDLDFEKKNCYSSPIAMILENEDQVHKSKKIKSPDFR